ncbi:four-helix bundle copper-binding protein [Hymenobacter sp. DG25A]|uniref:four-helix bundle copper-binding protein n=1 Tax=Hymenobacter sp. DG25A TaxID=1385663 RepID=UPI0006BC848E|nr:four-helix bundle copper-binding protein [Hymenobacter sp. DG25A]ALD20719.1 ferredoxin [Hymenobacter sp. DG25A]
MDSHQLNATSSSTKANQAVLDALYRCISACENCATACLHEEDVQMMTGCILLDRDCADVCSLTARLVARDSEHAKHMMKECIEICQKCAAECGKHDMDHCKECAEACRACAHVCGQYAG